MHGTYDVNYPHEIPGQVTKDGGVRAGIFDVPLQQVTRCILYENGDNYNSKINTVRVVRTSNDELDENEVYDVQIPTGVKINFATNRIDPTEYYVMVVHDNLNWNRDASIDSPEDTPIGSEGPRAMGFLIPRKEELPSVLPGNPNLTTGVGLFGDEQWTNVITPGLTEEGIRATATDPEVTDNEVGIEDRTVDTAVNSAFKKAQSRQEEENRDTTKRWEVNTGIFLGRDTVAITAAGAAILLSESGITLVGPIERQNTMEHVSQIMMTNPLRHFIPHSIVTFWAQVDLPNIVKIYGFASTMANTVTSGIKITKALNGLKS